MLKKLEQFHDLTSKEIHQLTLDVFSTLEISADVVS